MAWLVAAAGLSGCRQPVEIPPTEVKTVEAYGVKLDELATPQQVTFVLLRSMRDDVEAAQAGDRQRQKQAFRVTFSLGAFSEIEKRLSRGLGRDENTGLGESRERKIYDVIYHWAPIVGHYVRSFDLDEKTAVERTRATIRPNNTLAVVQYDVAHDPAASEPAERQAVVLEVTLTREKATAGTGEFWRVARVDFRGPATRPVTSTAGR